MLENGQHWGAQATESATKTSVVRNEIHFIPITSFNTGRGFYLLSELNQRNCFICSNLKEGKIVFNTSSVRELVGIRVVGIRSQRT